MTVRRVLRGEDGASLVLALAFVTFMAVFSVAILSFTGVGATTSTIATAKTDQLYAADAGMEYGIANLKADTTRCSSGTTNTTWPTTTVNGKPVTYSCSYLSGGTGLTGSALLGEYGAILTGGGGIAVSGSTSPTNVVFAYEGSIHSAGPLTSNASSGQMMSVDGNLTLAGACPPSTGLTITSPGTCTPSSATPALPTLGVYVPSAAAPAPSTSGSCTTLFPGKYGGGGRGIPSFNTSGQYYLANGVYYINGGNMTLAGTVFGGQMSASDTKALTGSTPCRATDPNTSGYTGSGVTFVLGGNAKLLISNANARVELFTRVPGGLDAGATPGVGVWAASSSASLVSGSGAYTASTTTQQIVWPSNVGIGFVEHGLTYVPSSSVQLSMLANAPAGGASVFTGGLVASALSIVLVNSDSNQTVHVAGAGGWTSAPRTVALTSTAAGTDGAAATTVSATVVPDGTVTVSSWRVT